MFDSNDTKHPKGTILVDYEVLLDELIDETRELLLKKKKENKKVKEKNSDLLFDEFIYVNSLRNAKMTLAEEYFVALTNKRVAEDADDFEEILKDLQDAFDNFGEFLEA